MILKFLQKNNGGKNEAQEQFPKVKTFSRAHEFSPAASAATGNAPLPAQHHFPAGGPEPEAAVSSAPGKIRTRPAAKIPESIGMQDTLWTNSQYLIHFTDDDGTLLHTCEVSAGEMPVYEGKTPSKPEDLIHIYTFAGWTPEIRPASGDTTYTAVYSYTDKTRDPDFSADQGAPAGAEDGAGPADDYAWDSAEPSETFAYDNGDESEDTVESPAAMDSAEPADMFTYESAEETEDNAESTAAAPEETDGWDEESGMDSASDREEEPDSAASPEPEWDFLSAYRSELAEEPVSEMKSGESAAGFFPVLESAGKTALKASWQPVPYADGYDVFFAQCGSDFDGVYRTLSPEASCITFDSLEKRSVYKLRVRPFTVTGGEKTYIGKSRVLRSVTGGKKGNLTNACKIRIGKKRLELSAGDRERVKASLVGQNPDKKVLTHGKTVRYLSDNPSVASVSKKGKVRGIGPGLCHIVLLAPNGIHRSVPVSVRPEVPDIRFRKKQYSLYVGDKINLRKKLKSVPDEDVSLKWKSSDRAVAYVNDKGIVTGLKEGKSTVSVRAAGGARARVKIRVDRGDELDLYPWESISITKGPKK